MTDGPGPPDPDAHLDLDTLAELDEGLTGGADAAAAESHLTACRPCREQQARLRSTRALLAALPGEPMPPDVAGAVHDALARAPLSGTVLPLGDPTAARRRRWRSRPTLAGLAATAAVVALVAAVAVGALHSSSKDNPPALDAPVAGSAAGAGQQGIPITASGRHYTAANAHRLVQQIAGSATEASGTGSAAAAPSVGAGTKAAPAGPDTVAPDLQPLYTSQQALLTCVAALTAGGRPVLPLTVDFATFSDKAKKIHRAPALVVVLPGPAGRADGWIVGPDCATAPDNNIYLFERVPIG